MKTPKGGKGKGKSRKSASKVKGKSQASPSKPRAARPAGLAADRSPPGVWVERDPAGRVTMLHHPTRPYREHWEDRDGELAGLFEIANQYLRDVNDVLELPTPWLEDLVGGRVDSAPPFRLGWLRDQSDPRQSHWSGDAARTAVLLAGLRGQDAEPLFGGQGLRVIVHIDPKAADGKNARITGVWSTLPHWSGLPPDARAGWGKVRVDKELLDRLGRDALDMSGLGAGWGIADVGLRVPDALPEGKAPPAAFYGLAKTVPNAQAREKVSYSVVGRLRLDRARENLRVEQVSIEPLIAGIDATAKVFKRDPISKNGAGGHPLLPRPNRSWKILDNDREQAVFRNLSAGAKPGTVKLEDPDGNFRVTNSRYVDYRLNEDHPKEVDKAVDEHVRTNIFAAVNAYYHTSELFRRMKDYGFVPASYFAFVNRPILVRYRAGIHPWGMDGRTINAQVRWTLPRPATPGDVEVCFALADLQSSVGKSPLGIASDPRWCWHEFSHLLLIGATGQKEFSFAHSAGDALAAIVSDPESRLAVDRGGNADNEAKWRGVTFPWVFGSRRHDRDVADGWSWTGALYQKELFFAPPHLCNKRGYWAEQLLSSALFRLYRAIGGDTVQQSGPLVPDTTARREASDYVVYLIMKAIKLAGTASSSTVVTPVDFVSTLIQAEISSPPAPVAALKYAAGSMNKVVLWAFEQQGLFGNPVPGSPVVGPESRMLVDLHIDDRRNKQHGPYTPVAFRNDDWQAHPNAVWVQTGQTGPKRDESPQSGQDNYVYVRPQNRGRNAAANVTVEVWWAEVTASGDPPLFPDPPGSTQKQWHSLGNAATSVPAAVGTVPGEAPPLSFKWPVSAPQAPPLVKNQRYAILVSATCVDDRSNLDPATGYACATKPGAVALKYVVACDNNLGLRVVTAT